jgi:outer membrane protein assembly factor BamB
MDRNGDGQLSKDEVPQDAAIQLRKEVPKETPGNMLSYQMLFFAFFDANKDGIFTRDEWTALEQFMVKNRNNMMAIRPGGSGNISTSHVRWRGTVGLSEMPSPLYYRGRVYFVKDGGMLTSYDAKSGKVVLDRERLGVASQFVASPVAAGGNIYAASVPGKVAVIHAADRLEVLSLNDLGEGITATPAVVEGKIYIRTAKQLWAFGE